ncbi:MAG: hypothetical protein ASARMPRED_009442 [Alectoria sarmentosa]|nr:MAG: hypothetical protein ASARMPRED_009442 [Alectoria sarmentosa]
MPTATLYLIYFAISGMTGASALSLQDILLQRNQDVKSLTRLSRGTALPLANKTSSNSILATSGAFPGYKISSISSKTSPTAASAYNSTFNNETLVTNASSSSVCCFVVQDTINVRYWADYSTYNTVVSTHVTTLITFATQYIDTTVTTKVSTVVSILTDNSTVQRALGTPGIPNPYNEASGPSVTQIGLNGSLATAFATTITSPTQFYVFPSVNVIKVPAVIDKDGRLACATTSMYRATCPAPTHARLNASTAKPDRYTESAKRQSAIYITGVNSNAERYFNSRPNQGSAMIPENMDVVQVSFSNPFVYAPLSDRFPSKVINENLGYVPQTLIDWMAQDSDYASKIPGIASCLPGGPSLDFASYFCSPLNPRVRFDFLGVQNIAPALTVSSTVTVAGEGCFHPGACPTPAAPAATAVATTPEVTPQAERSKESGASSTVPAQDIFFPTAAQKFPHPQAPSQPLPAPAETPSNTPVISPENQAVNPPPSTLPNVPSPSPPGTVNQPHSAPIDVLGNPSVDSSEDNHGANPLPKSPAKPPSLFEGLGAMVASIIGITPTFSLESQDIQPNTGSTPALIYSISIAPSASAVVINSVTSVLPAGRPEGLFAGIMPITVGSHQIAQNAASQYVVAGQTITPGAPPINVQGTEVSLAPSASAIVIAGSTITLSSTSAPEFTAGAETVTANSASQYVFGGQTLTPGGPAITVSGTRISLAPGGTEVFVGSSTIELVPTFTPRPSPPPLTLGSQIYTADSKSEYTLAGQTLIPGGPALTISGTRLSLAPSATQVVVGSSTIRFRPTFTPPPLKLGSQTFTANSASDYIIDGQTLVPGSPAITVSGTPISLAPDATQVVIGSRTIDLVSAAIPPLLTFDSKTFTANSASDYIIDGQTLVPGAPALTLSNTPISLAPDASEVVIGVSTEILRSSATIPPIVIGSQTFTANSASDFIIDGQTLIPGAPALTISNTPISLAPGVSEVVIGGSTEILRSGVTLPPIVIGSQTFTANNAGAYVIGTQTLTPGASGIVVPGSILTPGPSLSVFTVAGQVFTANPSDFPIDGTTISAGGPGVMISGTPISLQASGVLDIGKSTITLSPANSTNGLGLTASTGKGDRTALSLLYSVLASSLVLLIFSVL